MELFTLRESADPTKDPRGTQEEVLGALTQRVGGLEFGQLQIHAMAQCASKSLAAVHADAVSGLVCKDV